MRSEERRDFNSLKPSDALFLSFMLATGLFCPCVVVVVKMLKERLEIEFTEVSEG